MDYPAPSIDLAVIKIGYIMPALQDQQGVEVFYARIEESLIPPQNGLDNLSPVEDIYVVGYPNNIWDSVNNLPVLRRGVTATHPNVNYERHNELLIDSAIFGSSGVIADKFWHIQFGTRTRPLGVVYGVYVHKAISHSNTPRDPHSQQPRSCNQIHRITEISRSVGRIPKAQCQYGIFYDESRTKPIRDGITGRWFYLITSHDPIGPQCFNNTTQGE